MANIVSSRISYQQSTVSNNESVNTRVRASLLQKIRTNLHTNLHIAIWYTTLLLFAVWKNRRTAYYYSL